MNQKFFWRAFSENSLLDVSKFLARFRGCSLTAARAARPALGRKFCAGIADDLTKFYSITDLVEYEELIAGTRKPEAIQYVLQFAFKSVTSGYTISYLVIT